MHAAWCHLLAANKLPRPFCVQPVAATSILTRCFAPKCTALRPLPPLIRSHLVNGHHLAGLVVPVGLGPQDLHLWVQQDVLQLVSRLHAGVMPHIQHMPSAAAASKVALTVEPRLGPTSALGAALGAAAAASSARTTRRVDRWGLAASANTGWEGLASIGRGCLLPAAAANSRDAGRDAACTAPDTASLLRTHSQRACTRGSEPGEPAWCRSGGTGWRSSQQTSDGSKDSV